MLLPKEMQIHKLLYQLTEDEDWRSQQVKGMDEKYPIKDAMIKGQARDEKRVPASAGV